MTGRLSQPSKLLGRYILLDLLLVSTLSFAVAVESSSQYYVVFLLPFLILHKLNMRPQVKISVYAIFLLGFIDIAFSLTRFLNIQLTVVGDFRSITAVGKSLRLPVQGYI